VGDRGAWAGVRAYSITNRVAVVAGGLRRHDVLVRQSSGTTTWQWRFRDADGAVVGTEPSSEAPAGSPSAGFGSRSDAETWLGEHWRPIAAAGAVAAELLEGGAVVGPVIGLVVPPGGTSA
jgi:hypothetical protein